MNFMNNICYWLQDISSSQGSIISEVLFETNAHQLLDTSPSRIIKIFNLGHKIPFTHCPSFVKPSEITTRAYALCRRYGGTFLQSLPTNVYMHKEMRPALIILGQELSQG